MRRQIAKTVITVLREGHYRETLENKGSACESIKRLAKGVLA